MDLTKLLLQIFRTLLFVYIGLTYSKVSSKPTLSNTYKNNVQKVEHSREQRLIETTTDINKGRSLSESEETLLGEVIANSLLKETEPRTRSRYRRLSLMGLDNVGTAATVLERMRSRMKSRWNSRRTSSQTTSTSRPVHISRTRTKGRMRNPNTLRPDMIYSILKHIKYSDSS